MSHSRVVVRARRYWCVHRFVVPYWAHHAYELEIVGHGWTMAPHKNKITEWALDFLACDSRNDGTEWDVTIEWVRSNTAPCNCLTCRATATRGT